jgi:hypothetical protein
MCTLADESLKEQKMSANEIFIQSFFKTSMFLQTALPSDTHLP